jgi:hypothetical protein
MLIGGKEYSYDALVRSECIYQCLNKKMCNKNCVWCDVSLCEVLYQNHYNCYYIFKALLILIFVACSLMYLNDQK